MTPLRPGDFSRLLMTHREAAVLLAVSERTLWKLRHNGEIPFVRIGRCVRYRPSSLKNWVREQEQVVGAPRPLLPTSAALNDDARKCHDTDVGQTARLD
jgi:excisionase family DNA binding protein